MSRGWRASLASYLAGALLSFAYAPFAAWPVIFIALPILYLLLESAETAKQSAARAFMFGYGFFMAGTYWIANALLVDVAKFGWLYPISVLGLSGVMALWFGVFGWALFHARNQSRRRNILRFAVLWVVVEYLRTLGIFGFPWNLVGYIALDSLYFAQAASLIGTFGLSFFIVLIALLPLCTPNISILRMFAPSLLLIAACVAYGVWRIPPQVKMTDTQVRIVQPSIPQTLKADARAHADILSILTQLTQRPSTITPSVILWPETALPFTLWPDSAWPPALMRGLHAGMPLITGVVSAQGQGSALKLWNSVVGISPAGDIAARYGKHQLVPFGEFVPLRDVLPLDKITPGNIDFSRGAGPQTVAMAGMPPFSPLVCYEVIFPWIATDTANRPHWLVNVTNDGWYGDSPGPYQHFAMSRMRAIEQGLPLARAANNGISAMIDPYGQVSASLALNAREALDAVLPAALPATFYAKQGEWPVVLLLLVAGMLSLLPFSRNRK